MTICTERLTSLHRGSIMTLIWFHQVYMTFVYTCMICETVWLISCRKQCCPREPFASPHECNAYSLKCCVGNYNLEQCNHIIKWEVLSKILSEDTPSQIAKLLRPTSIRYWSNAKVWDWYQIDVDPMVFAICEVKILGDNWESIVYKLYVITRYRMSYKILIYLSNLSLMHLML